MVIGQWATGWAAIRRNWHADEWWFSVIDVAGVLFESNNANRYWSVLKRKLAQEAGSEQAYEKIVRLKLTTTEGKQRVTDTEHPGARGERSEAHCPGISMHVSIAKYCTR